MNEGPVIVTHCPVRLGDNLAHLHFLLALARAHPDYTFRHYAHGDYIEQLRPMIAGSRVELVPFGSVSNTGARWCAAPAEPSINSWKDYRGFWSHHHFQHDYGDFMLSWCKHLARLMGLESPFESISDLLFDYPALRAAAPPCYVRKFDFLIVNSPGLSGQSRRLNYDRLDELILNLAERHRVIVTCPRPALLRIPCTQSFGYDVTMIGKVSQLVDHVLMVATGPSWPTFNVWNAGGLKSRVILVDAENIQLDPKAVQADTAELAAEVYKAKGLL